jgi:phosphoribosylaminoimidazole-succinocarboxamide synthase
MLARRADVLPVECIVRGYLAGSGWNEYRRDGTICGIPLPPGLVESDRLPEPIFTPSTKAVTGHDENISFEAMVRIVGEEKAERVRALSLELYRQAAAYAERQGIIIADTKFEFGEIDGQLIVVDEALTPDSSRFWPADGYRPGGAQPSFDKQYVRDYLLGLDWDRQPPAPPLPAEVIRRTSEKYLEAYRRLTGAELLASL